MRDYDLEIFSAMLKRPGLIMGTNDWNEVENFIRAYDLGSKWESNFLNLLTEKLRIKYGVPMPSEGLIKQFQFIADKENINLEQIFKTATKEILIEESDKNNEFRFKKILQRKILNYFEELPELIGPPYFINLNQINRQIDDWHGENINKNHIQLFKEIKDDILKSISGLTSDRTKMSDELKNKIINLKSRINNER